MQKFKSTLIKLPGNVWDIAFIVPTEIANHYITINDKRVVCVLNNELEIHAALMPKGENVWFINTNAEIRKKLKIGEGDIISVEIRTDTSKYGMPISEEMEELLKQDEIGRSFFENLTMGKQRALIHQVNTLKSSDKRLKKAITMLDYLVRVKGKLDFKELNLAYKNSRLK